MGFYYQYPSLIFPQGKTLEKLEIQAPGLKIGKQVIKRFRSENRISMVTISKKKVNHFMYFTDVFCEFRQVKNNRRVNRDKISQLIGLTNRRNIVEIHDFWRDFLEIIAIFAEFGQKSRFNRSFNREFL